MTKNQAKVPRDLPAIVHLVLAALAITLAFGTWKLLAAVHLPIPPWLGATLSMIPYATLHVFFEQYWYKFSRKIGRAKISNLADGLTRQRNVIIRAPGSLLSRLAEFLFSPKTLKHVVNPIISDMQVEYCEALAANRRLKAVWTRLRGYWSFFKAVGLYSLLKTAVEVWHKIRSN